MTTTTNRSGHQKYVRKDKPTNIALTEDDDLALLETFRHDVVDSAMIYELLPHRPKGQMVRRLNLMFQTSFLERLAQREREFRPGGGSWPIAMTLGKEGVKRIRAKYKVPVNYNRYRGRSKMSATAIRTKLEQSRTVLQIRASAARYDHIEFLYPDEYYRRYAPHILESPSLPSTVRARVNWHGHREVEGTKDDGLIMLIYHNKPEGQNKRAVFIESDEETETVQPSERKQKTMSFWRDTSWLRKGVVYGFAHRQEIFKKDFGLNSAQVLTVTKTKQHAQTMQEAYRKYLGPRPASFRPHLYMFTDDETIAAHDGDVLSVPFEDGSGKVHSWL